MVLQVLVGDILFNFAAPTEVLQKNRIIGFIALQRLAVILTMFFPLVKPASFYPT